jgi:hypothetical protein
MLNGGGRTVRTRQGDMLMTDRLLQNPLTHKPLTQTDLIAFWSRPIAEIGGDRFWNRMNTAMLTLFIALRPDGYRSETRQGAFQVAVPPDADLAAVRAEVEQVLPHLLPFTFESPRWAALGPVKMLGVFEHTLSDPTSYALLIDAQGQPHLVNHLFGHWTFTGLDEALAYIQEHHWYGERAETAEETTW